MSFHPLSFNYEELLEEDNLEDYINDSEDIHESVPYESIEDQANRVFEKITDRHPDVSFHDVRRAFLDTFSVLTGTNFKIRLDNACYRAMKRGALSNANEFTVIESDPYLTDRALDLLDDWKKPY